MTWSKGDKYYLRLGQYTVSKDFLGDTVKYCAWYRGKPLGIFDNAEEAKQRCHDERNRRDEKDD